MDPEKRRELARKGAKRVHELGRAHRYTSAEARAAALKLGKIRRGELVTHQELLNVLNPD